MDNSRCVILVPASRHIEPYCEYSLRQLEAQSYIVRRLYGFAQVDVARNRLASESIADGFEELMWIDSDIAFEPQSVQRLRSHSLPIVCGLYPKKLERVVLPVPARSEIGHPGGRRRAYRDPLRGRRRPLVRRQVFLQVQRQQQIPTCFWRGTPPTTPFFLPMVIPSGGGHLYLGEDFAFCERARRCGFQIFADTSIRLQHIGIYDYSWEDVGGGLPRYPSYRLRISDGDEPADA